MTVAIEDVDVDVDVVVPIAILASALALAFTRALRGLREPRTDQSPEEPVVTLAVLPGRRAVVTVDANGDRSAGAADLVDHAVRHAFTLNGIDSVEVRQADGELLERRVRPIGRGAPANAVPLQALTMTHSARRRRRAVEG